MSEYVRVATANDLRKIIIEFNKKGVKYILVGGFAMQVHGYVRATQDIDFVILNSKEQGEKVIEALSILEDNEARNLDPAWFEEGEGITLLDEIQIDLLFKTSGGHYKDLEPYIQVVNIDGIGLNTLTLEGLLRTKKTYREKDIPDRLFLERMLNRESNRTQKTESRISKVMEAIRRLFKFK